MPVTVLGTGDLAVNKEVSPCSQETYIPIVWDRKGAHKIKIKLNSFTTSAFKQIKEGKVTENDRDGGVLHLG